MKNFTKISSIEKDCLRDFCIKKPLKINTYEKSTILPARLIKGTDSQLEGGVVDKDGAFVAGFTRGQKKPGWRDIRRAYTPDPNEIVYEDKEVIFGGLLIAHFGHVVLECFSRLWPILNNPEMLQKHFVFVTYPNVPKWFYEFFDLIGIDKNKLTLLSKPTTYKSVIVPDESIYSVIGYYPEYINFYDHIIKSLEKEKLDLTFSKKIYLSRSKFKKADMRFCVTLENEEYFEDFFRKRGFIVVSPETLSIKEQILLMHNAEVVVATAGTLTHLVLFSKPNTKLIILNRDNANVLPQHMVNQARKIDYSFVDIALNFIDDSHYLGCKLIGITPQWKEFVKYFFNEDIPESLDYTLKNKSYNYIKECVNYFHGSVNRLSPNEITTNLFKVFDPNFKKIEDKFVARINTLSSQAQTALEIITGREILFYKLHFANLGWIENLYESYDYNFTQNNRIEAIALRSTTNKQSIEYGALNQEGWTTSKLGGQVGSTGKYLPITGFYIKSTDPKYNVQYRALVFNNKSKSRVWTKWIPNGEKYTLTSEDEVFVNLQIKVLPPEFPAYLPNANSQSSINKD